MSTLFSSKTNGIPGVFSPDRVVESPKIVIPQNFEINQRMCMEGLSFLGALESNMAPAAFFDPQFRGVYDKLQYGNEDTSRNNVRVKLPQMSEKIIAKFIREISRVLIPAGHLFLWIDKYHLCSGFHDWIANTQISIVDMVTWDKCKIGLGYRTRHQSEFCLILQKEPRRAKGVWTLRNIPDVWSEKIQIKTHPHNKPIGLQGELIEAVTHKGDLVIDPAAGSFSVLEACWLKERNFLGCDIQNPQNNGQTKPNLWEKNGQ